jgi:hypothetical protein
MARNQHADYRTCILTRLRRCRPKACKFSEEDFSKLEWLQNCPFLYEHDQSLSEELKLRGNTWWDSVAELLDPSY